MHLGDLAAAAGLNLSTGIGAIEIGGLATNNVLSSPEAQSDIAAEIRSTSRLVSNWSVHALEFQATTLSTFYEDFPSEDDKAWSVEGRGRHRAIIAG